jgi:DNA-binding transcriptional LysR family regulator
MAEPLNWDEFRIVRAIAEARTLAGAAERLGLNHSTMFRRLSAIEAGLGVRLFERERGDYRPTATGADMAALAALMGDTISEFERRVAREDVHICGLVRVTTLYSLGILAMAEIGASIRAAYPTLQLELLLTEASLDLHRGEVDIALRCMKDAPRANMAARRVAQLNWAIYAGREFLDEGGALRPDAPWVAPTESFGPAPARAWVNRHVEPRRLAIFASNDLVMAELAARGAGAALLPAYAAARHPELLRVGRADPELDSDLWLIASNHAFRTPRVRAVFDFLAEALAQRRAWFEGEAGHDLQAAPPASHPA